MLGWFLSIAVALLPATSVSVSAVGATEVADSLAPFTIRGFDARIQDGIDLIYRLEFEAADEYFDTIVEDEPDNPLGYFFRAMLIDLEEFTHDAAFYRLLDDCIEVCDRRLKTDEDDFDAILFKAGAIGFRGRLRGDRHEFVRAASDGLKCLPLLKRSRDLEPTNKDILFGQGIYNYFAEVIPERHPIARPLMLFLPDGDRELGIRQLEEVASSGRYARAEAAYFLAQIHRVFEEDKRRALRYIDDLCGRYPENALFQRYRARTLAELGRWDRAVPSHRDVLARSVRGERGYHTRGQIEAHYYLGKYAFIKSRLEEARDELAKADSLSWTLGENPQEQAVRGFVALANLYLGMTYDQLGRRPEALHAYERVRRLPKHGASHKLASRYAKTAYAKTSLAPPSRRSR